jgi:hypothetical protein
MLTQGFARVMHRAVLPIVRRNLLPGGVPGGEVAKRARPLYTPPGVTRCRASYRAWQLAQSEMRLSKLNGSPPIASETTWWTVLAGWPHQLQVCWSSASRKGRARLRHRLRSYTRPIASHPST